MICNKYNDEVIVLAVCSGGVLQECAAEFPAGSRGRAVEGGQGEPNEAVGFLALGWPKETENGSSLKTGPARPGHVKIALDITAVDTDLFFLYCTGAMIIYDRFSL